MDEERAHRTICQHEPARRTPPIKRLISPVILPMGSACQRHDYRGTPTRHHSWLQRLTSTAVPVRDTLNDDSLLPVAARERRCYPEPESRTGRNNYWQRQRAPHPVEPGSREAGANQPKNSRHQGSAAPLRDRDPTRAPRTDAEHGGLHVTTAGLQHSFVARTPR